MATMMMMMIMMKLSEIWIISQHNLRMRVRVCVQWMPFLIRSGIMESNNITNTESHNMCALVREHIWNWKIDTLSRMYARKILLQSDCFGKSIAEDDIRHSKTADEFGEQWSHLRANRIRNGRFIIIIVIFIIELFFNGRGTFHSFDTNANSAHCHNKTDINNNAMYIRIKYAETEAKKKQKLKRRKTIVGNGVQQTQQVDNKFIYCQPNIIVNLNKKVFSNLTFRINVGLGWETFRIQLASFRSPYVSLHADVHNCPPRAMVRRLCNCFFFFNFIWLSFRVAKS